MKTVVQSIIALGVLIGTTGYSQPLDSLLQMAVANNPELKALQLEYEAALTKTDQVDRLPDPGLGAGVPILRPETRLGPQLITIGASQMFPWFGTRDARKEITISMSKARFEKIAALKLDLFHKIKASYIQLQRLEAEQEIVSRHTRVYETLRAVALARVENGQSTIADVFRVDMKLDMLEAQGKLLENEKHKHYSQINSVVNRLPDHAIAITGQLDSIELILDYTFLELKVSTHHPLIKSLIWMEEASRQKQELIDLSGKPMIGVGLDYTVVGERTDAFPMDNGRDILVPKVRMTIPLFKKTYEARNQEQVFIQESLQKRREGIVLKYLSMVQMYQTDFEDARIKLGLYKELMGTTQKAIDILVDKYSSSGMGFDEILKLREQLLNYETMALHAFTKTHVSQINIDRLTDF